MVYLLHILIDWKKPGTPEALQRVYDQIYTELLDGAMPREKLSGYIMEAKRMEGLKE